MWLRVHDGHKLILQIKHLTFWSRFFLPSYTWKGSDEHQAPNPNITTLQTLELVTTPPHLSNVQFPSVSIDTNVYIQPFCMKFSILQIPKPEPEALYELQWTMEAKAI